MSDAKLRELERRWRETGAVADQARWLHERLRLGELEPAQVELAGFMNHRAALVVVDQPRREVPAGAPIELQAWVVALREFGWEALYRLGVADVRHKQDLLANAITSPLADGNLEACRTVVARRAEALEDWILDGGPASLRSPDHQLSFALQGLIVPPPATPGQELVPWAYEQGLRLTAVLSASSPTPALVDPTSGWVIPGPAPREPAESVIAAQAEVAAWALGIHDPLRLRLSRLEVASPCHAEWKAMSGDDRVRSCAQCKLQVYDLSQLDEVEATALVREREGRVCVRFFRRADGRVQTRDCSSGLQQKLEPYQLPPPAPVMGRVRIV